MAIKENLNGKPGPGRPKGLPNKITVEVKAMIENALIAVGGQKYLEIQALENPVAFMSLVGRILPKDLNINGDAVINIILKKP